MKARPLQPAEESAESFCGPVMKGRKAGVADARGKACDYRRGPIGIAHPAASALSFPPLWIPSDVPGLGAHCYWLCVTRVFSWRRPGWTTRAL